MNDLYIRRARFRIEMAASKRSKCFEVHWNSDSRDNILLYLVLVDFSSTCSTLASLDLASIPAMLGSASIPAPETLIPSVSDYAPLATVVAYWSFSKLVQPRSAESLSTIIMSNKKTSENDRITKIPHLKYFVSQYGPCSCTRRTYHSSCHYGCLFTLPPNFGTHFSIDTCYAWFCEYTCTRNFSTLSKWWCPLATVVAYWSFSRRLRPPIVHYRARCLIPWCKYPRNQTKIPRWVACTIYSRL